MLGLAALAAPPTLGTTAAPPTVRRTPPMIRRIARRLRATFRGPSPLDALAASAALAGEVRALRAEVSTLRDELARLRATAEPFHARPGTIDGLVFRCVVGENEYRLPERFDAADAVLDVGAHVGSFSLACLLRGAGHVLAVEPVLANHDLLAVNLARFGRRARSMRLAAWRSDGPPVRLALTPSHEPSNTAGGRVTEAAAGDAATDAVPLDALVADFLAETGRDRLRLLKLDCEGSEYPILLTATCLGRVDEVCGEYHDVGRPGPHAQVGEVTEYRRDVLVRHLAAAGFRVETTPDPVYPQNGTFWARRA